MAKAKHRLAKKGDGTALSSRELRCDGAERLGSRRQGEAKQGRAKAKNSVESRAKAKNSVVGVAAEKKSLAGFAAATVGREKNAVAKLCLATTAKLWRSLARESNGEVWLREATAKVGNVLQWHSLGSPGLATAKHGKRRRAKA